MRIEACIGLCIALALGVWAYIDMASFARAEPTPEPHFLRAFDFAIVALIVAILTAVSGYLFVQVPALLWKMTAGLLLGSLSLRLLRGAGAVPPSAGKGRTSGDVFELLER
jgi:hypothetical protein